MLRKFLGRIGHGTVWHDLVKKSFESWLRVTHNVLSARKSRDSRGSFIAVKIDDQIKMTAADFSDKTQERQNSFISAALVNKNTFINIFIAPHKVA